MDKILSFIKNHKKPLIIGGIVLLVLIIVIVAVVVVTNMGPMGYKKKIEEFETSLSSEKKMKDAVEKYVDLRAAVAWQEANQKSKDFKEEYKDVKKDSDDLDELKDALIDAANSCEDDEMEYKVSNVKKPKKDKKNGNIWTVKATIKVKSEYGYSDGEYDVKFVFYKNQIIDILSDSSLPGLMYGYGSDQSLFESILDGDYK